MEEGILIQFKLWRKPLKINHCGLVGLLLFCTFTQVLSQNPDELRQLYQQQALRQSFLMAGLVNVAEAVPEIRVGLSYASDTNVFKTNFYHGLNEAYLVKEGVDKLRTAQEILQSQYPGFHLLVLDAARPRSVQREMWAMVEGTEMEHYVAYPEGAGSLHNIGCAIDLIIVDSSGKALDMGFGYDHFGWEAEPGKHEELLLQGILTEQQVSNRMILRRCMQAAGFQAINREWWHFNVFPKETARSLYSVIE